MFYIMSNDPTICPVCDNVMKYRDSLLRHMKLEGQNRKNYMIRRLQCTHCGSLHRELPDCFVPYKHYGAEIISGAVDGIVTSTDADSEDYPCEMTINRWKRWLAFNTNRINGYLRSIGFQVLGFSEELLKSTTSLLDDLRSSNPEWLETILRFIYNSGGFLAVV